MKKIICASLLILALSSTDSSAKLQQVAEAVAEVGAQASDIIGKVGEAGTQASDILGKAGEAGAQASDIIGKVEEVGKEGISQTIEKEKSALLESAKDGIASKLPAGATDLQSKIEEQKAALATLKEKQDLEIKNIEDKIAQDAKAVAEEKQKQAISSQAEQYRNKFKLDQAKKASAAKKAIA